MEEENKPVGEIANVGDTIDVFAGEQKGEIGKVLIVRENSVIVDIGNDEETGEPIKTVVNHKNYNIMK